MATLSSIREALHNKIGSLGITSGEFYANLLIAILLVIIGIFLGKIIKFFLRKGLQKIKIEKIIKWSFIELFLTVIKWSIYILFIDFALLQINIPTITSWLTTILGLIPALTGALIIISAGFGIASYLRNIIVKSKVRDWLILSQIFFFFVNYVFIIFAFRTALISLKDAVLVNLLLVIFTLLGGVALLIYYFSKTKNKKE